MCPDSTAIVGCGPEASPFRVAVSVAFRRDRASSSTLGSTQSPCLRSSGA